MIKSACIFLLVLIFGVKANAQTCSIVSDSVVCVNDFITFQLQNTGTAISYAWDLGDGQTSTQATPFVKYTLSGMKTIRVVVQLSGGGSCTATKVIQAHALPIATIQINSSSNYCLSKNLVCVDDLSKQGLSNSPIVKRVILFGDGFADISFNPSTSKQICHRYNRDGNYTIILEVTDSKGCINRAQTTVTVVRDVRALFGYSLYGNCDTAALCLINMTQTDSNSLAKWYWNFGNGVIDSSNWTGRCLVYRDSGVFSPQLVIHSGNGCSDSFKQNGLIRLSPIVFDVVKDKYVDCVGSTWTFEDKGPPKDKYFWYYKDTLDFISHPIGQGNPLATNTFEPGKKYISLTIHRGSCISTYLWDSVLVRGPVANADIRNKSICIAGDTTYFCDKSDYRGTIGIKRLWDFGDKWSPACTTDTKSGINVGVNCGFSVDASPRHLYLTDACYTARLFLIDTVTGCEWEETFGIQVGAPKKETIQFTYTNDKACVGNAMDRTFAFNLQGNCYGFQVLPDSLAGGPFFPGLSTWNYSDLSNPNGFVSVGLVLETGPINPSSCPGITMSPVCRDTLWYSNWIHIINEPAPYFKPLIKHGCAPFQSKMVLQDTSDTTLTMAIWSWGDGGVDTIWIAPGTLIPSEFSHTFLANGQYDVGLYLINNRGCALDYTERVSVGHKNEFEYKLEPCLNECLTFSDSTVYYGDTNYYWTRPDRLAAGKEKMWWSFGDGTTDTFTHPIKCFKDTGIYQIRLITMDTSGCFDTSSAVIEIGGIKAGISAKDVILCSEIVQFMDSSVTINPIANEAIVSWYWDFGDGTTPSYLLDPYHFYSAYGKFDVRLIIYTTRGCVDTAYKTVDVVGPIPAFEFVTDSIGCVPFEIELKNVSRRVKNWIWYFGDPGNNTFATLNDSNVRFRYEKPGIYYLQLYGADSIYNPATQNNQYCSFLYPDTTLPLQIARKVIVLPIPPAAFLVPDTVCVDAPFTVADQSDPKYTRYAWYVDENWDSLISSNKVNPYVLNDTGLYRFTYFPTYVPGAQDRACYDSASKLVRAVGLEADFDFDPRSTPLEKYMDNLSTGATSYWWDFGHPGSLAKNNSTQFEPIHRYYPDKGVFEICLIAWNKFGCIDTLCKIVELDYPTHIFIPNVFTPGNNDDKNEVFDIDILGEYAYHLKIYNRWSELVYQSETDGIGNDGNNWEGKLPNGSEAIAGVYYVVFDYEFLYSEPVRYTGTLTLIR